MSAEAAKIKEKTIKNKTELSGANRESFGRKQANPVPEKPKDIKVPGLSNDNAHKDAPDWSVFSLNKFHPHLGLAQISLTALGLLAGLAFAFLATQTGGAVSMTTAIFSYLAYGLIGLVGGYFSLWMLGAAVVISPLLLLGSFFI